MGSGLGICWIGRGRRVVDGMVGVSDVVERDGKGGTGCRVLCCDGCSGELVLIVE